MDCGLKFKFNLNLISNLVFDLQLNWFEFQFKVEFRLIVPLEFLIIFILGHPLSATLHLV